MAKFTFIKIPLPSISGKLVTTFITDVDCLFTSPTMSDFIKALFRIIANMDMDCSTSTEMCTSAGLLITSLRIQMAFLFGQMKIYIMVVLLMV
jgi:hypothetical protein